VGDGVDVACPVVLGARQKKRTPTEAQTRCALEALEVMKGARIADAARLEEGEEGEDSLLLKALDHAGHGLDALADRVVGCVAVALPIVEAVDGAEVAVHILCVLCGRGQGA
jgi:hypothetical protein